MRHSASSSSISSTSSLTTSTTSSTNTQHTTHHPSVTNHRFVHILLAVYSYNVCCFGNSCSLPSFLPPSLSSSVHPSGGGHYGESEVPSVVFRDRPSVKSLANRFERNNRRKSSIFSSNSARKKWRDFEKKVTCTLTPPPSLSPSLAPSLPLSLPRSLSPSLSPSLSHPLPPHSLDYRCHNESFDYISTID